MSGPSDEQKNKLGHELKALLANPRTRSYDVSAWTVTNQLAILALLSNSKASIITGQPANGDASRAEMIRSMVAALNSELNRAKDAGLKVELILNGIGTPNWTGYYNSVKISRDF